MQIEKLNNLAVVMLGVNLWSGQRRLRPEDLTLGVGGELPPEEVATLGSKKTINPQDVAWGLKFKARMLRTCLAYGTRFLGGYAIPKDRVAFLTAELDKIVKEARDAKDDFVAQYHDLVEKHIEANPKWEAQLRNAITPVNEVNQAFQFSYSVVELAPAQAGSGDLASEVAAIGDNALAEIALEMRTVYKESYEGQAGLKSRKALRSFERVRTKIDGLSFLDAAFAPMVDAIDTVLNQVPKRGDLPQNVYLQLVATALILSDPEKVRDHGKGLVSIGEMARAMQPEAEKPPVASFDPGFLETPVTSADQPKAPIKLMALPVDHGGGSAAIDCF